jgi:hypothetical protein
MCPYGHGKNKEAKEMKKTLIAVAAAAALATTSAFAEITFGSWLRVLAAPVASNGEDVIAAMGNSWGWGARSARVNIDAVSEDEKVGFSMGVYNDAFGGLGDGDRAVIWAKPIDQIKVSFGKFDSSDTGLRGDFTFGSWAWFRPYNWLYGGEGLTFSGNCAGKGAMIQIYPVEGLSIVVNVPLWYSSWYDDKADTTYAWNSDDKVNADPTVEHTYLSSQVGVGYAIDGVGRIKVQWIGKDSEYTSATKTYDYTGRVEAAFDLTAVDNLYLTVGVGSDIGDKEYKDSNLETVKVALGVSYQVTDEFRISADGAFAKYKDDCVGKAGDLKDNAWSAGFGIDYAIADGLNLTADVRYKSIGYGKDKDEGSVSFLAGVTKAISSNGLIGVAFQGATNGCNFATQVIQAAKADSFVWAVPVQISVWF